MKTTVLLDSNIVIDHLNGIDNGIDYFGIFGDQGFLQRILYRFSMDILNFTGTDRTVQFAQLRSRQSYQRRLADRAAKDFKQLSINGHNFRHPAVAGLTLY